MRAILALALLLTTASGCVSNHYVRKNGGAPLYEVRIINNCSAATGVMYLDDEYRNRRKIDVKPRRIIANRPQTYRIPGGRHTYRVEFDEVASTRVMEGAFIVEESSILRLC